MNMNRCKLKILSRFKRDECCVFCKTNLNDSVLYGPMYRYGDIATHYFCLLLSSNISQKGDDKDGILGFLPKDINKEVARGRRLLCTYCRKNGATIGCSVKACRTMFHLPCGIANDVQNIFFGNFWSFCSKHRSIQYIPRSKHDVIQNMTCLICLDSLSLSFTEIIWTSCCKTAWYHKMCIQKVALNSGYYFRCPNCNDEELFREQMLRIGIYIPDQDASWEFERNAYSSLNERYSHCDAAVCLSPGGRDVCHAKGNWQVILCYRCLDKGIHKKCGQGVIFEEQWICSDSTCLNASTAESNLHNLYFKAMPQTSSGKTMQSVLPESMQSSACTYKENKENSDPNFAIKEVNNAMARDGGRLRTRENLNVFYLRRKFFTSRKTVESSSIMANMSHYAASRPRNLCRALTVRPSTLSTAGRRIKERVRKLERCDRKRKSNDQRCNKVKTQKNVKNSFEEFIGKRRKKYVIDQQVVRIYPCVMKRIKDFEISLDI